jgi:predicted Rossmann fold nucleotide-binding protein DprA/Smf involved in DNA uptake
VKSDITESKGKIRIGTIAKETNNLPVVLQKYFANNPEQTISYCGNLEFLSDEKTAFFCSSKSSGAAILKIFERANFWRKEQITIISGFHSPLEKEVLDILLKGKGLIIICPARSIESMLLPKEWLLALEGNRLLIISPFTDMPRISRTTAEKRNQFIAQIADRVVFGYISESGKTAKLLQELDRINKPVEILGI